MQGILEVWINAFIPRDVPNYTRTVAAGPHGGKTAVPLPKIARLNPLNMLKPWNEGFLTDQRGFSDQQNASTRMQSSANIAFNNNGIRATVNRASTSGTISVDIASGKELGTAGADLARCSAEIDYTKKARKNILTGDLIVAGCNSVVVSFIGKGSDPLVSLSADIDYEMDFQVINEHQNNALTVIAKGKIDDFPAFEAYVRYAGKVQALFQSAPPEGNTVTDLLGFAKRRISGSARWPIR